MDSLGFVTACFALTTFDGWVAPLRASGADVCLKAPFAANDLQEVIRVPA